MSNMQLNWLAKKALNWPKTANISNVYGIKTPRETGGVFKRNALTFTARTDHLRKKCLSVTNRGGTVGWCRIRRSRKRTLESGLQWLWYSLPAFSTFLACGAIVSIQAIQIFIPILLYKMGRFLEEPFWFLFYGKEVFWVSRNRLRPVSHPYWPKGLLLQASGS